LTVRGLPPSSPRLRLGMPVPKPQAPTRHVALVLQRRWKEIQRRRLRVLGVRSRRAIRPATPSHARRCRVHRIPSRVSRRSRYAPRVGRDGRGYRVIWVGGEQLYFCAPDWTTQIRLKLLEKLPRARKRRTTRAKRRRRQHDRMCAGCSIKCGVTISRFSQRQLLTPLQSRRWDRSPAHLSKTMDVSFCVAALEDALLHFGTV
jgi:hypothetical protein